MATIDVLDFSKKKVGSAELNAEIFEQPVKKAVMHAVVKWQLACRRAGTHSTKTKGEVSGGGKKPFKQKGTGNARQGSSRSIMNPGGGVAFGPKPRDYSYTLPRKIKQAGLKSALSYLFAEGRLIVVDKFVSQDGKTKDLASVMKNFGLNKAVMIDGTEQSPMKMASRNLSKFRYYSTEGLNVYDLLKYDTAIISKDSLEAIAARCGLEAKGGAK